VRAEIAFRRGRAYDLRMSRRQPRGASESPPRERVGVAPDLLRQRELLPPPEASVPAVWVRQPRQHPSLFRKMLDRVAAGIHPGDLVAVRGPTEELLGYGYYNPLAEISVRLIGGGEQGRTEGYLQRLMDRAIELRVERLRLPATTTAYRVIHAEADGWPGLVVDRYGDVLSAEAFSLAMYQRGVDLLGRLSQRLGTTHWRLHSPAKTHGQEGFVGVPIESDQLPLRVVVEESGTRFQVDFATGHKTGFFCDQRDNRLRLTRFTPGRTVLDLCCYTGGFSVQAARLGQAASVTAIDLDEEALGTARVNARLNAVPVKFVHVDAFQYLRDLISTGQRFDVVVLDPPKLIRNRAEIDAGTRKHLDLNRLALQVVADGGLLVTCSCSGLLSEAEFTRVLRTAALQSQRTIQVLERSGASADHPVRLDVPETGYLQAVWLRVQE